MSSLKFAVNCRWRFFLSFLSTSTPIRTMMMMKMSSVTIFSRKKIGSITTTMKSVQLCTVDRFLMNHWTILKNCARKIFKQKKINSILKEFLQFSLQHKSCHTQESDKDRDRQCRKLNSWLVYEIFLSNLLSCGGKSKKKSQLVCWNRRDREQFLINCRRTIFYNAMTLKTFFFAFGCREKAKIIGEKVKIEAWDFLLKDTMRLIVNWNFWIIFNKVFYFISNFCQLGWLSTYLLAIKFKN